VQICNAHRFPFPYKVSNNRDSLLAPAVDGLESLMLVYAM